MVTNNSSNTYIVAPTTNEVTMPLQPAFMVVHSVDQSNVTGDNTTYKILFNTKNFDQNNDFNSGLSTFTAPVTGIYWLNWGGIVKGYDTTQDSIYFEIVTSNNTYKLFESIYNRDLSIEGSILADMDAADTSTIQVNVSNGNKVIDISFSSPGVTDNGRYMRFSGFLSE